MKYPQKVVLWVSVIAQQNMDRMGLLENSYLKLKASNLQLFCLLTYLCHNLSNVTLIFRIAAADQSCIMDYTKGTQAKCSQITQENN